MHVQKEPYDTRPTIENGVSKLSKESASNTDSIKRESLQKELKLVLAQVIERSEVPPHRCAAFVGSDEDVKLAESLGLRIYDVRTMQGYSAIALAPSEEKKSNVFVDMQHPRRGKCISYNYKKGFGFLQPLDVEDANQIFVHQSTIHSQGFRSLIVGKRDGINSGERLVSKKP